jgi:hypothetical protein
MPPPEKAKAIEKQEEYLPSGSVAAKITINVIQPLLLTVHERSHECEQAIIDVIDQSHFFNQNSTS